MLDRRHLLAGLAAGSATVTAASAAALALEPASALAPVADPVFAAIEAHRAAWRAWDEAVIACDRIVDSAGRPAEMASKECQDASGWTAANEVADALDVEEEAAFVALFEGTPTTLPGLAALAAHGMGEEAECHGKVGAAWLLDALARGLAALSPVTI